MDREPVGDEKALFNSKAATEYDEHWVGIDVPVATKLGAAWLRTFEAAVSEPWLEFP